jgi:hypothetical protein
MKPVLIEAKHWVILTLALSVWLSNRSHYPRSLSMSSVGCQALRGQKSDPSRNSDARSNLFVLGLGLPATRRVKFTRGREGLRLEHAAPHTHAAKL